MLKIERKKIKKKISEEEMLKWKNSEPFATFRQEAKGINFGFIFGMSFKTFGDKFLALNWSPKQIESFIQERNLQDKREELKKTLSLNNDKASLYTVSEYIRTIYFKTYPGLMERIKRRIEEAKLNGYVRSYHGAIRRLPLLLFADVDDSYSDIAYMYNISSNTTIQNDEACLVMKNITKIMEKWKNCLEESRVIGTTHDSVDFYIRKDVLDKKINEIYEVFESTDDWQKGIKLQIEITVVDLEKENQYYKHGTKLKRG